VRARVTTAALLVLAVLAAGCGGDGGKRGEAIASYFTEVNQVQAQMARPLLEVSKANRAFAQGKADPAKTRARLAHSEATFAKLRRKLSAIHPPPDGERMQKLLLELVDRQRELSGETLRMARFLPQFVTALQPVGPAGKDLRTALNGKGSADVKAAALELYAQRLGSVLAKLRPLDPPSSSRPTWQVQVRTLASVRTSVLALARALREKRSQDVATLLHRFDVAAAGSRSLAAQRLQIAAIRAYNQRVRGLDRVSRQIALERVRLQKLAR
jgi:hypothetical protein